MPTVVGKCALCGQNKELIESHVIPRTVIQWMKVNSGTGRLRRASEPNKPLQDGVKDNLMCADCDGGLLGPKEKRFMETIFRPHHQDKNAVLTYDADLLYFAASLAFRVIVLEKAWHTSRAGVDFRDFDVPLKYLQRFLLGLTRSSDGLEHYITLTSSMEDIISVYHTSDGMRMEQGLPGSLGFDLMRGFDSVALPLKGHLVTFVKLPGFLFVTVLKPRRYHGSLGTRISSLGGTLTLDPDQLLNSDLLGFLEARSRRLDAIAMSEAQAAKVEQMIENNPERWKDSASARLLHLLKRSDR
ncbi:hypothetical protein [Deinococcus xinjiangensis]